MIASAIFTVRRRESRALLGFLLAFDLANATLVALGRYWTLPVNALSSRYQYGPLLCFFPSAGVLLDALATRGDRTRAALRTPFPADRGVWPNIPPLHASSAPELVQRFHLH